MTLIEFVIGGIGFPLIFDIFEKAKYKRHGLPYRLSLLTKVALVTYVIVAIVGLCFAYSFEYIDAA